MNIKFIELELDWPSALSVFHLRSFILSKLMEYGEPLRWAITSVTTNPEKKIQIISVEVVLITNQNNCKGINSELN